MNHLTFILAFACILCVTITNGVFAQCAGKVELVKVNQPEPGKNNGSINIKVSAPGKYHIELVRLVGTSETIVSRKEGTSSRTISFENLPDDSVYKVIARFPAEEKFLCQTKALVDIVLNSRSN